MEFKQPLQVYFFDGYGGAGKVSSWSELRADAQKMNSFEARQEQFIKSLPREQKTWLSRFSTQPYTSRVFPGTNRTHRSDAEQEKFLNTLSPKDRNYLEANVGLGRSQKAEVAWLDRRYRETGNEGYLYEELEVSEFSLLTESGKAWKENGWGRLPGL